MVGIFTGTGAGLERGSANALGNIGQLGGATNGRGGESLAVNAATGNLVISRRDEFLVGRSLDIGVSRTYNSFAEVHDGDNGDQWQMSTARRIFDITNGPNAAGSTLKRVSGDGSVIVYAWENRGGTWAYWTTDGSGAHDRVYQQDSDTWVWVDGSTQISETYDADPDNSGEYRIVKQSDEGNQSLVFEYTGDKLTSIRTNNNEYIRYTWVGDELRSVKTEFIHPDTGQRVTQTGTYYTYTNGRLSTVTVDLTPESDGVADNDSYTISYEYNGAGQISRVTQKDGSRTDVVYDSVGRVVSLAEHVGDGSTRVTTLTYGFSYTDVTAPNGQTTRLEYTGGTVANPAVLGWSHNQANVQSEPADSIDGSATGLFTSAPGATWSGVAYTAGSVSAGQTVTFELSLQAVEGSSTSQSLGLHGSSTAWGSGPANGSAEIISGPGTLYQYNGGFFRVDGLSAETETRIRITRTYTQAETARAYFYIDHPGNYRDGEQLLASGPILSMTGGTTSADRQLSKIIAPPAYSGAVRQEQVFTYDADGNLLASINPKGETTRYEYDERGNVTLIDRPLGTDAEMLYDARNNLTREMSVGSRENTAAGEVSTNYVRYTYDAVGLLLYRVSAENHVTEYRYDAYRRLTEEVRYLVDTVPSSSSVRDLAYMDAWRDSAERDLSQLAITKYFFDTRGNISRTIEYGGADGAGQGSHHDGAGWNYTNFTYDQEGRLLSRQSSGEGSANYVYDGMGRLISSSDASGAVTSVFFDDAQTRTVMQMSSGLTRTMVYNKAGDLISETESASGPTSGNMAGDLDAWGYYDLNRTGATAIDGKPAYKYTSTTDGRIGRVSKGLGTVAAGETVKYRITLQAVGSVTSHTLGIYGAVDQWGDNEATFTQGIIINGPGTIRQSIGGLWKIENLSTTQATTIELTRTFDSAQSVSTPFYVGGGALGAVGTSVILSDPLVVRTNGDASLAINARTENKYDKLGRLRVSQDMFDARDPSFMIYDNAGRRVGMINSAGALTEYFFDEANRVIGTVTYTNRVAQYRLNELDDPNSTRPIDQIRPALAASGESGDVRSFTTYDANGRIAQTFNGQGDIVSYEYDEAGRLVLERNHFKKRSIPSSWLTNPPSSPVSISNDPEDAVTRTFYDRDGNVRGVLDGEGYLTETIYDQAGRAVSSTAYVNKTTLTNSLTASMNSIRSNVTGGEVRTSRMVYDGAGRLRFEIDAERYVTEHAYDSAGKRTISTRYATRLPGSEKDYDFASMKAAMAGYVDTANDRKFANYYDDTGRIYRTNNYSGLNTYFYYDYASNLTKTVADDRITRAWYDARGNVLFSVDAEGYLSSFVYNEAGQVTNERRYESRVSVDDDMSIAQVANRATGDFSEIWREYDAAGRVISEYDQLNVHTRHTYHADGRLEKTERAYDSFGDTADKKDRTATTWVYDKAGRIITETRASDDTEHSKTTFVYDGLGNRIEVRDANNHYTKFTYDDLGRVLTEENPENEVITYEYNAFGEVAKTWDAKGVLVSEHVYDRRGLVERSYDALGNLTRYTYNGFGEVATVRDARNAVTTFTYDKLGRVKTTTDARGFVESYTYNAHSNRTRVTNKLGGRIDYTYDKLGRVTNQKDALGYDTAYTHDSRGNVIQMQQEVVLNSAESNWHTTDYEYDDANRLTSMTVDMFNGRMTETYTYDNRGNMTSKTAGDGGKTVYFYDDLDRVTTEINAAGTYTTTLYDRVGNVTSVRVFETTTLHQPNDGGSQEEAPTPSGASRFTQFKYDDANRMIESRVRSIKTYSLSGNSVIENASPDLVTQYQYDENGNAVVVTDPNGVMTSNAQDGKTYTYYDELNRKIGQISSQVAKESGDLVRYVTEWEYDPAGNVSREIQYAEGLEGTVSETLFRRPDDSNADRITEYTYDLMGNRTSESRLNVAHFDGNNGYITSDTGTHPKIAYQYNGLGQVTKKTEALSSNVTDYTYDKAGRLTKEVRAAFRDFENTLVRPEVIYSYDGLGNLTKTRQTGNSTVSTRETLYSYKGGKLEWMRDALGQYRYYGYDAAGRENEVYYTRANYYGQTRSEGVSRTYDEMGRVVSEFQGTRSPGGTWTAVSPVTSTAYTAHGEVASVQLNDGTLQTNQFDRAGRLIKTNIGDGVYKLFGYDANGNQIAAITSAGYNIAGKSFQTGLDLIDRDDVNITLTKHDGRNQAVAVIEPDRDISTTASNTILRSERGYNAFGEVAWERDASGAQIDYAYNTMGKVVTVTNPQVWYQQENSDGTLANAVYARPIERFYHDKAGRLVAQQDANGNLTEMQLLNGTGFDGSEALVTKTFYVDGGTKETKYDMHGDARRLISVADGRSTLNRTTEQRFDKLGRVTQTWHRGSNLQDNYTYDINGRQLSHWNNVYGSSNREVMDYDAMGRVISARAFGGDLTTTTYTWERSTSTNAVGNFGGFKKTTDVTGIAVDKVEWTDVFGRTTRRRDHGNNTYVNNYDLAGRLTESKISTSTLEYEYYNTGKLRQAVLTDARITYSPKVDTTYGYDKVGNLTYQRTYHKGNIITQDMRATYDGLGRLKTWRENGNQYVLPRATANYTYDANGNIRRIQGTYRAVFSNQTSSTYDTPHDAWYRYDSMNRVVTSKGKLNATGDRIVRGTKGLDITYNAAGQRKTVTASTLESYTFTTGGNNPQIPGLPGDDNHHPYRTGGLISGAVSSHSTQTVSYYADNREEYVYDNGGRLRDVKIAKSTFDGEGWQIASQYQSGLDPQDFVNAPGSAIKRADFTYDSLGRIKRQQDYEASGSRIAFSRNVTYSTTDGYITREVTSTRKGGDVYNATTQHFYNADNTLNRSITTNSSTSGGNSPPNTRTDYTYRYFDTAVQNTVVFDKNTAQSGANDTSYFFYNSFGHLFSSGIYDGQQRDVFFDNTVDGQVIKRKETLRTGPTNLRDTAPLQLYYRFGGKEMGRVGNDGTSNVSYEKSIEERQLDTSNSYGPFRNRSTAGVGYADFGGDYEALNSYQRGSSGGMYTVRGGESLQAIAYQLWGDAALWYKIAEANGLSGREALSEGRNLVIPTGVQRVHHNAGTVKPYDPSEAIGDLSPTSPAQPNKKKNKCGVFGQILSTVVAIAASYVFGPILGNVVSQGFNILAGFQKGFSFKSLAISALSTAVSAGVGSAFGNGAVLGSQFLGDVVRGAASSAITQGISTATGLQDKFSWSAVAAAGVGAGVGGAVLRGLSSGKGYFDDNGSWNWNEAPGSTATNPKFVEPSFGARAASSAASAIAKAATRSAIDGTSFGRGLVAAVPDVVGQIAGGALGRSVGSVWGDKDHTGVLGLIQDINEAPTKVGSAIGEKAAELIVSGVNDIRSLLEYGATEGARDREFRAVVSGSLDLSEAQVPRQEGRIDLHDTDIFAEGKAVFERAGRGEAGQAAYDRWAASVADRRFWTIEAPQEIVELRQNLGDLTIEGDLMRIGPFGGRTLPDRAPGERIEGGLPGLEAELMTRSLGYVYDEENLLLLYRRTGNNSSDYRAFVISGDGGSVDPFVDLETGVRYDPGGRFGPNLPQVEGYELVLVEHTHPTGNRGTQYHGPSNKDVMLAAVNPGPIYVVNQVISRNTVWARPGLQTQFYYFTGNVLVNE